MALLPDFYTLFLARPVFCIPILAEPKVDGSWALLNRIASLVWLDDGNEQADERANLPFALDKISFDGSEEDCGELQWYIQRHS